MSANPPYLTAFGSSYSPPAAIVGGSGIYYHNSGDTLGVKYIPTASNLTQFGKSVDEAKREADIALFADQLSPHIVGAQGIEIKENGLAMLLEHVPETARNNYRLESLERLTLMRDVSQALTVLHQNNIMHGDISPENILYNMTSKGILGYITDFGEARRIGIDTDFPGGTRHYQDPERQNGTVGYMNDVYSFGKVAQELLNSFLTIPNDNYFSLILQSQLQQSTSRVSSRPQMSRLSMLLEDTLNAERELIRRAA